jgi:hypothetical protein
MWSLDNRTPFAADKGWIRDINGAEVWIVAVKATYDILPDGATVIASNQPPVNAAPVPHAGMSSLLYETDIGAPKGATDVVLNGHAYVQDGKPVTELPVGFRVGSITRTAKVIGDRLWQKGILFGSSSKANSFTVMPLVYERAFGGDSPDLRHNTGNPVGRGIAPDKEGHIWLPNIESIAQPLRSPGDRPPVMGFGAIPSHWQRRRQFAGTYDKAWLENRSPLLPEDFDARHWQIAPPEQQVVTRLKGGEPVVFINLTQPGYAKDGKLAFTLPKLSLGFETMFYNGVKETSRSVIHTVILEPDFPRVSIVHHMALPCHPRVNLLNRTRITMKRRPLDRPPLPVSPEIDWPEEVEEAIA